MHGNAGGSGSGDPANAGGAGGGASGHAGGSAGSGFGGGAHGDAYPRCDVADDCPNWFCNCKVGPPVNTRHCTNHVCEDAAQACPASCAAFSTCWLGTAGGGFTQGSNAGPSTCASGTGGGSGSSCTQNDLGEACKTNSECQSGLCFGASPSFMCTKGCTQANDCPYNWKCVPTSAGGSVCMSGVSGSATASTSHTCSVASYPDVGAPCTSSCASGFCTGNACTRRCDVSSDCPAPWRCIEGTSFKFCAP